ncbi:MAG: acyl-CoA thioesterase [Halobacteriovoraceae bacterium]|nr:acyl-CoA thioesterase [Halobacteriovoraceae bacterium]MCB9093898.1 acyl-CoA thioesterase [Halobacteriovoraceae bacterium]
MDIKSAKIFNFEYIVQDSDLDIFHHVNNSKYFVIFEKARWDFITNNGFTVEKIQKEKRGPVLLEVKVRFKRELKSGDVINIVSQASEFDGRFLTVHQIMKRDSENCCEAFFKLGFFDTEKRKMLHPDKEWIEACGIILEE